MWKARETAHHAIDEVHVCIWTCNTCNVCNVCNSKIFGGLTVSRGEPVLDLECLQRLPETQFGLHNGLWASERLEKDQPQYILESSIFEFKTLQRPCIQECKLEGRNHLEQLCSHKRSSAYAA
eukprot:s3790_g29.t1